MAKEWKPSIRFVPRKKQFSFGGVMVVLKPAVTKVTNNGIEAIKPAETVNIEFGADNMGTFARTEEEEIKLLELAEDPRCDICTYDNREMEPVEKDADKLRLIEKKRADKAENELEALKNQLAAGGIRVEDGKVIKTK